MPATIAIEAPRQSDIEALLHLSDVFAHNLYPPESNFLLNIEELERPEVAFFVARDDARRAVGMAALVRRDSSSAELKRMFVHPFARGCGVASALLEQVETDAAIRGIREIVLETGPLHDAALALYRRHGYEAIPQFGPYVGEEFSVCLAKTLWSVV
jgi:putative acetyltransferase